MLQRQSEYVQMKGSKKWGHKEQEQEPDHTWHLGPRKGIWTLPWEQSESIAEN